MNRNVPLTQTCHTVSQSKSTDVVMRRCHPICRQAPGSDGKLIFDGLIKCLFIFKVIDALKLTSACLEIRLLRPDITEEGLRDLKTAIQAANNGLGAELEDEIINPHCETKSPDAIFQFDFFLFSYNSKFQPQSTEHSEGPSKSKKRKRISESNSEEPIACNLFFHKIQDLE
jgi:hypothetical protein